MTKRTLLYGAVILLASNLIIRIMGFVNQVLVLRTIGPEGFGLIQMAFPIYLLALVVASAGIPTSVARMIAEAGARGHIIEVRRIFRLALSLITVTGLAATVTVYLFVPAISGYIMQDPRAYRCFLVMIPSIFLTCLCSLLRGYFQGLGNMAPTAVSQLLEQLFRVVIGLYIAYRLLPRGIEFAAIGYSAGMVLGDLAGLVTVCYLYSRHKPLLPAGSNSRRGFVHLARELFSLAFPISVTRVVTVILYIIDSILIPARLHAAGFTIQQCTEIYGKFTGIGLTLLAFPTVFTISLATTLIPGMSEAAAREEYRLVQGRASESIRLTILGGLPMMVILVAIPTQVSGLFFGIPEAGGPIRILASVSILLYLFQTTTGILQGLGKVYIPLRSILTASAIKCILIYYLTAIPDLNIHGTALAFVANYIIASILNLVSVAREVGLTLSVRQVLIKPAVAALGMSLTLVQTAHRVFEATGKVNASTTMALVSGLAVYLMILMWNGGVTRQELQRLTNLR